MELTSPDEHIEIHLHVEQFSQKTNETGRKTYVTKAVRSTWSCIGRKEKWSGQDLCPWEETQKRSRIMWAQRSSLGSEQFKPCIGCLSPEV